MDIKAVFFCEGEMHPLMSLMGVIGVLVENYETKYISELEAIA